MGEKPNEKADNLKTYKTVKMTDELNQKNEDAKKIADELIRIGVWTWDDRASDIMKFAFAEKDRAIVTANFIKEEKKYDKKNPIIISGAEYRHKLAMIRAMKVVDQMKPEVQKIIFQDVFQRDTMPDFDKDEALIKKGLVKLLDYQYVVGGETAMRVVDDEKSTAVDPKDTNKTTPATGTTPPKVAEPPKADPAKSGGRDNDDDTSMLVPEEWMENAIAQLREQTERKAATLGSLGLPGSIADAVSAANLQLAGVSATGEATKLAFAKAKTQTSKDAVVAA